MATAYRNTGTSFRFDGDDLLWHAKLRVQKLDADGEDFLEFLTEVATLIELLAWIASILDGLLLQPGATVAGHPASGIVVTLEGP